MGHLLRYILTITQAGIPCKWANDSQRFLLEHLDSIHDSPSHIYHSAMPFSPSSTWLQKCYGSKLSQEVRVVKGLPDEWSLCSHTVSLATKGYEISCWKNIVAVGSAHKDIIILDAITGSQTAILSGHTDDASSVAFSSDGRSLVSGSDDKTVKLWDMQTGGAIKTFSGHNALVCSVSISVDSATIASGSHDETIRLWDTQTRECCHVINLQTQVYLVKFSPTNPQYFLSESDWEIKQWNISGYQVGPTFDGYHADFSPDGTQIISHYKRVTTVQNSNSREVKVQFPKAEDQCGSCCFSPDSMMAVVAAGSIANVWNISSPEPHLVRILIGHARDIVTVMFSSPSSLISISLDGLIKFWEIGAPLAGSDPKPVSHTPVKIMSITLQAKDNIFITSDSDGVVRTCDIFTGICKASFQTPATGTDKRDVQLSNGWLVLACYTDEGIKIWNVEKGELLHTIGGPKFFEDLKISEDGSRVFSIGARVIQAQSIQNGETMGEARIRFLDRNLASLAVHGSRVWVHYPNAETQVWEFGTPGTTPFQLLNIPLHILHPSGVVLWDVGVSQVKVEATGKIVFRLSKRYEKPVGVQWDNQYLVMSFISGELLVLNFSHVLPQ